jgi:hypothetical protein
VAGNAKTAIKKDAKRMFILEEGEVNPTRATRELIIFLK